VEIATAPKFIKSSFCQSDGCVELAFTDDVVLMRDSKIGEDSPVIEIEQATYNAIRQAVLAGEL